MEAGERTVTLATVDTWLKKANVSGLAVEGVRGMWHVARRHGDNADQPVQVWFIGWIDAEGKAHTIRLWAPLIVPGLLQTWDYSYHVFRAGGLSHDRATELTDGRMERQKVFERSSPPVVVAIIDETVLHREIGNREVMAKQCKRLLDVSEHPSVHIQVVRGASAGLGGMLALADGSQGTVLLSGSTLEDIVTADAQQVQAASAIVDAVRGAAKSTGETRVILGEALTRWTA
ncbi:MAG TPA: DUF5753 domain-containing protein [Trebonia sp.]|nr:DUF5753 domain-containing protein [Trebonia sp.]